MPGLGEGFRDALSAFADARLEAEEYRELDHERVLVLHRKVGRGRTSGMEVGQMRTRGADVFHVRGGKVTKLVSYWGAERALAALGLSPGAGSSAS